MKNTQPLRIGYLSSHNYYDRNAFSGILYSMYQTIAKNPQFEVQPLGAPYKNHLGRRLLSKIGMVRKPLALRSATYLDDCKTFARRVERQLKRSPCDVLFAPVGSSELAYLKTDTPIIYLSDATHKLYEQYYNLDLSAEQSAIAKEHESMAIKKANLLVYSSKWAGESAVEDYEADPSKVRVITFGPNIDYLPNEKDIYESRRFDRCRLLFIGKDWERKGGDIALQTMYHLRDSGLSVELTIVGCNPDSVGDDPDVRVIPFLDKRIESHRVALEQLLLKSHFLLFPTRADCSPLVICEASAYGLPVVTANVGGLSCLVDDGKTGYLMKFDEGPKKYSKTIFESFSNRQLYHDMIKNSLRWSKDKLNWDTWCDRLLREAKFVCGRLDDDSIQSIPASNNTIKEALLPTS